MAQCLQGRTETTVGLAREQSCGSICCWQWLTTAACIYQNFGHLGFWIRSTIELSLWNNQVSFIANSSLRCNVVSTNVSLVSHSMFGKFIYIFYIFQKLFWPIDEQMIVKKIAANFQLQQIIVWKITATFRKEQIIARKFTKNYRAPQIIVRKFARIKTIGMMKMWGNFVKIRLHYFCTVLYIYKNFITICCTVKLYASNLTNPITKVFVKLIY